MAPGENLTALAAAMRRAAGQVVVLTGAGISIASQIPAFRSPGGLWDRYDPMEYATIDAFLSEPERVWEMLRALDQTLEAASPNPAHRALAELEDLGLVRAIITQNVDGLHQAAGSKDVVELHGSRFTLSCLDCGRTVRRRDVVEVVYRAEVPRCQSCGGLLKPDVVLFGEELPVAAIQRARRLARECELFLVVGTSAEVEPSAGLPALAAGHGAEVWEVNPQPSLTAGRRVGQPAENALPALVVLVRR